MIRKLRLQHAMALVVSISACTLDAGSLRSRSGNGDGPIPGGGYAGDGSNASSPMGTNLSAIADYSVALPFVDVFKTSRSWISGNGGTWDDGRALDVDDDGWVRSLKPDQIARTLMLWDFETYPAGRYVVLYEGQGTIEYGFGGTDRLVEAESQPGRHVLELDPAGGGRGFQLMITDTKSNDPIRNIRVLLPGGSCEDDSYAWCDDKTPCSSGACIPFEESLQTQLFNPIYLQTLRRYAVLRFMDWMDTNHSELRSWDERPKLTDARWSEKGAPVEIMVALAHRIGAEPWFNMPHLANDDYVRRFAGEVRELLDPRLRPWVEYSNEVWNGQFSQHHEVAELCNSGQQDPYIATLTCYSERAVDVIDIWRDVFTDEPGRVVGVLGSQAVNPWASELIATHNEAHLNADALAIAPYFGIIAVPENESDVQRMSVDALLDHAETELLPEAAAFMQEQADLASSLGLSLVAYEGGQHFVGTYGAENNDQINALYDAVNRHPRMRDLYTRYLEDWREAGGEMFVHYTNCDAYSKWGRFGLLESLMQPRDEAYKYDAVQRFIEANPRWW